MSDQVKVVRNGGILEITLDNPKANAIDQRRSDSEQRAEAQQLNGPRVVFPDTGQ